MIPKPHRISSSSCLLSPRLGVSAFIPISYCDDRVAGGGKITGLVVVGAGIGTGAETVIGAGLLTVRTAKSISPTNPSRSITITGRPIHSTSHHRDLRGGGV